MRQNLGARIATSATMTPQLIQSIRFLQLSAVELEQEIAEVLDRNLMLESDDVAASDEPESFDDIQILGSSAGDGIPEERQPSDSDRSVRARLLDQLQVAFSDPMDLEIALTLLDALDETGYLEERPSDIARGLRDAGLDVDVEHVERVRAQFMQQDPAGIGALDLRECLLAQLILSDEEAAPLAIRIVSDHLEALANAELDWLCDTLDVDRVALRQAIDCIRRLNPKPGLDASASELTVPDAIVEITERGAVSVRLNSAAHPQLRLNTTYERMLGQCNRSDAAALNDQLVEARWFLRSIEMRRDTILRTVQAIFARQPEFLDKGEAGLRPMTLKQIADDIGMHESTICRVTTSKYIQTPLGVFELKRFFSSEVGSGTRCSASGTAVKAMIREIIADEPHDEPFCDADITAILARRGVTVARRTVAKYREALGIESAKRRAQRVTTLAEALA